MRSRGTPICSAGTYCVPCAAGPPPPANGAGATGGGGATRGAAGAGAAEAEIAAGAAEPAIAASMSCLLTRPPAPVPGTVVRSMPCSLAMRRTSGEECTRAASLAALAAGATAVGCGDGGGTICGFGAGAAAAAGTGAGAGAALAGAGAGAGAAAADPAASITATTVLIGTVWPSLTLISLSTPADGDGISASTLSVEISKSGSSRSTLSPGFFSHLVIVPSKMLSPIWGITTSAAIAFSLWCNSNELEGFASLAVCRSPFTVHRKGDTDIFSVNGKLHTANSLLQYFANSRAAWITFSLFGKKYSSSGGA